MGSTRTVSGAGQHQARIGVGQHPAEAMGRCPKNCTYSGGVALLSYQTSPRYEFQENIVRQLFSPAQALKVDEWKSGAIFYITIAKDFHL